MSKTTPERNHVEELREAVAAVRDIHQCFARLATVPVSTDAEALFALLRDLGYSTSTKTPPLRAMLDTLVTKLTHSRDEIEAAVAPALRAAETFIGIGADTPGVVVRTAPIKSALVYFRRQIGPNEWVDFHAIAIDRLPAGRWLTAALTTTGDFYQMTGAPRLLLGWSKTPPSDIMTGPPPATPLAWYSLHEALSMTRSWRATQREQEAVAARVAEREERDRQERQARDPANRLRELEKTVAALQEQPAPIT